VRLVRALGVTSPKRWPALRMVPAISEQCRGFESVGSYGIFGAKDTPPEIVDIPQQGDLRGSEGPTGGPARRCRRHPEAEDPCRISELVAY